ncbi:MAG: rhomboid family intramembrane serine protease [Dysgonamonadaceae bacterium]|jgi:membrane associated rhomboid family serine protease|nr:rhomboid family intramembrane serine protease [Dysgonamonadaceae bacterium]
MSYYQNNSFLGNIPAVTRNLLIINAIVWLACFVLQYSGIYLFNILGLHGFASGYFYIYQLVTYMFTHVDFWHLFFNMFALYMFGRVLESYWGQKRFLIYYLVTGIGAGIIQALISFYSPVPIIGASGAVFGILLAFGMIFPNVPLYLMFIPVPIKAKYMVIGYGLLELYLGFSNRTGDNVAHFAHLGGMLFGIILILYWRKHGGNWGNNRSNYLQTFKNKLTGLFKKKPPKINIHKRSETDWAYNARKANETREIDRILDKIKYSGYDSLSEDEKKKLFEAGKK